MFFDVYSQQHAWYAGGVGTERLPVLGGSTPPPVGTLPPSVEGGPQMLVCCSLVGPRGSPRRRGARS